ncbi:MAG TPA: response regulator transcription factor [Gemmatimonadaceae bacterium]|nr:response regulator transcription factor [Gemmatimonadaceae bacterium]
MSEHQIRIILADDHAVVREGLKALVNARPDMRVIGEAGDGESAFCAARDLTPDVLVVDLSMPGGGGADVAERVRTECPSVRVLALTVHEEPLYVGRLLDAGAAGYVLKRAAAADLVRAIRTVASGGTYIDPSIARTVVSGFLESEEAAKAVSNDGLTEREREVLVRIARGFSNKEIATALELSVKTVESYKSRVAEKLGLRSRVDIVRYAALRGWLGGLAGEDPESTPQEHPSGRR